MGKKAALLATLVLAAGILTAGIPGPASAGPTDPTVIFGAHAAQRAGQTKDQAVSAFETQLGRKLALVRVYYLWDQPFPDSHANWLRSTGHSLFMSVKAKRTNGSLIAWRTIADAQPGSALHNDIIRWATAVKNLGGRTYFTFHHEPEAAGNLSNGTAADFIAAWRKVIGIFRNQGVANVTYIWTMTDWSFEVPSTDRRAAFKWYPGDTWVDGLGADAYNWSTCRNDGVQISWKSLARIIEPFRQFGLAHPTEKLLLPEFGSYEDPAVPGRKAQWISDAQALFKQPGYGQFSAVLYYHSGDYTYPNCRWWADTSSTSLASMKAMATDPYYGGSP
jgi:Glycosyl hydrolase family 26